MRWIVAIAAIVAAGAYAYQTGSRLASRNIASLEQQLADSTSKNADLDAQLQAQREQQAGDKAQADEWRERYQRDVATGEIKGLFDLVRSKLDQGVTPDRLRFILEQTENKRDCDPKPQIKRLQVQTPLSRGQRAQAAFTDGVTITITGASARDTAGNPEAWFDPSQPVVVRLLGPQNKSNELTGPLPLHPSLLAGDHEYRFAVVSGPRGFAEVSMQRCRFP